MREKALSHWVAGTLAGLLLILLPGLASAQGSIQAHWVPRHVTFVYQGFTTHYSCDGLREKVQSMLEKLGARDIRVREQGCIRMVGVEPFPGVRVTMQVLVPASAAQSGKAGPAVAAHWHDVVLMPANAGFEQQGNCELIEQFKETFLPLFSTRNIRYSSDCVPHQLTLGTHLSSEVLVPEPKIARNR